MYHLGALFPPVQRIRRLPLSRDQMMLLMAAVNEAFLGLDTFLAHSISGTIRPREWIPIWFGPLAGLLLLVAGLIALRRRTAASALASFVLVASIVVGVLGAYFHIVRGALPTGPVGQRLTVDLMVWAPPILGPMAFAFVGILGISAAWRETPPDSGRLLIWGNHTLQLPYSKSQAYFFMVSMGILIALISSSLDHARISYTNPWLWFPVAVGTFGLVTAAMLGTIEHPSRVDLAIYTTAMLLLILVGVVGAALHIQSDLTSQSLIVPERFIRGAPFLAPLLYANMGMIGLIALLDPAEELPDPIS